MKLAAVNIGILADAPSGPLDLFMSKDERSTLRLNWWMESIEAGMEEQVQKIGFLAVYGHCSDVLYN